MKGKVKIVGGTFARRWVYFLTDQARPTLNRVRETAFQWLVSDIAGARVLDAFAGTGILAFESLSRGAQSALCYDICPQAVKDIQQTAAAFGIEQQMDIHCSSFMAAVQCKARMEFDILFLDPPFDKFDIDVILDNLQKKEWLHRDSLVYVEYTRHQRIQHPNFIHYKHKSTSTVNFSLLKQR